MFAISERVRPCSARCSPRSVGRVTSSSPSFFSTLMSRGLRSSSDPRGPLTRTTSGSIEISTPVGTGMGCFPIRLIAARSPDVGDDLATDARAAGLVAGHHASRRGQDGGAHATDHLRDLGVVHVRPPAGLRDPLHAGDDGRAVLRVLQADAQDLADPGGLVREVLDVALLAQHAGKLVLELGGRDVDRVVIGLEAVADAGEEIGYRVGYRHAFTSWTWSGRGRTPRGPSRAGRSGRGRTCGSRRAGGLTACSDCSCGSCTWIRDAGGPP